MREEGHGLGSGNSEGGIRGSLIGHMLSQPDAINQVSFGRGHREAILCNRAPGNNFMYWDGQLKSVKGCWPNIGLLMRML